MSSVVTEPAPCSAAPSSSRGNHSIISAPSRLHLSASPDVSAGGDKTIGFHADIPSEISEYWRDLVDNCIDCGSSKQLFIQVVVGLHRDWKKAGKPRFLSGDLPLSTANGGGR